MDAFGRTNKSGIWAVGDVTPGHALAHRAFEQGIVIAETIAGLNPKPVGENTVPQIVFSSPEAASVGLTIEQAQARENLLEVKETIYPMLANARMLMSGTAGSLTIVSGCDAADPDTHGYLACTWFLPWPPTSSPKPSNWLVTDCRWLTRPGSSILTPHSAKRSARRC